MATAQEVAKWMVEQMADGNYMYQQSIVYQIREKFGEEFTFYNQNGNAGIRKDVLAAFKNLTPDVVWSRSNQYWRKRTDHDTLGKRMVRY